MPGSRKPMLRNTGAPLTPIAEQNHSRSLLDVGREIFSKTRSDESANAKKGDLAKELDRASRLVAGGGAVHGKRRRTEGEKEGSVITAATRSVF
jgi:hypothetical protein